MFLLGYDITVYKIRASGKFSTQTNQQQSISVVSKLSECRMYVYLGVLQLSECWMYVHLGVL